VNRAWLAAFVLGALGAGQPRLEAAVGEPVPVMFQTAPGQFEVDAIDASAAQRVAALADQAWQTLAAPLALPESFSSPVIVRLIPALDWSGAAPFRVIVEAGGVVSVHVRWEAATPESYVRRALVQGLLMRLGVARHGVSERLAAPLWLEHACVGWWRTHAEPAQLDFLRQSAARLAPPRLAELLAWQRGAAEPARLTEGAVWLLTYLVGESSRAGEWAALLPRLLGGEEPAAALAATFPGRFANDAEREQWWQTGWHALRLARTLPGLEAADSRAELAELSRFVFDRDGRDEVVPLHDVLTHAREPVVDADLKRRLAQLNRALTAMHPLYRNAALSLAEALALRTSSKTRREEACAAFEQDWREGNELAAASPAALDALERTMAEGAKE
jgi:hypothetical protein